MSLSCALWATSLHQWARRYIRLTQPARCSPEKRARMHAFFAEGVDKMHVPWAVEGLPTLLHLSLFLFFGGLVIFLFNVDQEVFMCVVWWICLFILVYGLITLLPFIRHNSPYYSPISLPAWFLYTSISYVTFTVLSFIIYRYGSYQTWNRCDDQRVRYRDWMLGGVEKAAEEDASKRSSEIDGRILGWTIRALGDDKSLEKFFEAIPGFFNSKLVKDLERNFPETHLRTFWRVLDGFMGRTSSSNSVTESVKSHRVLICRDIITMIPRPLLTLLFTPNLDSHFDQAPVSIERLQAMAGWFTHLSDNVSGAARFRVGVNLPKVQKRDNHWIALASDAYSMAADDIEHNVALGGDNVSLAILIHVSRQAIHSYKTGMLDPVETLTQLDIRHTLPGLQHDFCTLWNEFVQEGRNRGPHRVPVFILRLVRHLYITLHRGTDAAPTTFSTSTDSFYDNMFEPSWYPLCDIASHRPDSTAHDPVSHLTQPAHSLNASPHHSTSGGSSVSRQVKEATTIEGPPSPSDLIKHVATSPALPVHTSPHPTHNTSPPGAAAAALQDISPATADIGEILSHASMLAPMHTLALAPAPDTLIRNKSSTSCSAGAASTSDPLLPASPVMRSSIPASPLSSRIPLLPKTPSHPTGNAAQPHLRARGLVNTGNMCFANAVLQLLVHTPAFCDLFGELGDLKGQREARGSKTGGGATPLVDALVRFFEEFVLKEPQPPRQAAGEKQMEDEEEKRKNSVVDSFEPTYMYDAMKEKEQLNILLVRFHD